MVPPVYMISIDDRFINEPHVALVPHILSQRYAKKTYDEPFYAKKSRRGPIFLHLRLRYKAKILRAVAVVKASTRSVAKP